MVRTSLWLSLLAIAATSLAAEVVPHRYIISLDDGADVDAFYRVIHDGPVATRFNFSNPTLFRGASIEITDPSVAEETLKQIKTMANVRTWPVRKIPRPAPILHWTGSPADFSGASSLNRRQDDGAKEDEKKKKDDEKDDKDKDDEKDDKKKADEKDDKKKEDAPAPDNLSIHIQTQVDKLRAEGYTGKGIRVLIIDTGIDYNHPALGGCFGPGCLISFGTDIVGDKYDGFAENPIRSPDDDPMDCDGHGTHVAGIVAAQVNDFSLKFTGAAPGVELGIIKTFGCNGGTQDDIMVEAFVRAAEFKPDIVTSSVGSPGGWSSEPWAAVVQKLVETGVSVTLAAGNSGDKGLFFPSNAASGKLSLSIASFDNSVVMTSGLIESASTYTIDGGEPQPYSWALGRIMGEEPFVEAENPDMPLWALDFDVEDQADACEPFPDDTPDLSGHIALIRRGTCTFTQKATYAAMFGAEYVMIYNNIDELITIDASQGPEGLKGIGLVSPAQGAAWIDLLKEGKEVVLHLTTPDLDAAPAITSVPNNATGGAVSMFSSWGPTWEVDFSPNFGSPGGYILSTYPLASGGYAVQSGTSMATPLVAGILALLMEASGEKNPATLANMLHMTAKPVQYNDQTTFKDFLSPIPQQGSGMVQAYDALKLTTKTDRSFISFNDSDYRVSETEFTIFNTAKEEVTYKLSNIAAPTVFLKNSSDTIIAADKNEMTQAFPAVLKFTPDELTIGPGEDAVVKVAVTPDAKLEEGRIPVWSGFIALEASNNHTYTIPYQGVSGSMHSLTILARAEVARYTPIEYIPGMYPIALENEMFTLPYPGTANFTTGPVTYVGVQFVLAMGAPYVRADLVSLSETTANVTTSEFLGVKSIGQARSFPMTWNSREATTVKFDGELDDGSFAPAGAYKFVIRSLKINGDAENEDDWETKETRAFRIQYAEKKVAEVSMNRPRPGTRDLPPRDEPIRKTGLKSSLAVR